jgi:hypothetical protein
MADALSFYDHHRQSYAHLELHDKNAVGEFLIGGYTDDGLDRRGEFKITLHRLGDRKFGGPTKPLTPKIDVFNDAYGALRQFVNSGALELLEKSEVWTRDDLTALLIGAGLTDRSDYKTEPVTCTRCCGSGKVPPALTAGQKLASDGGAR